MKSERAYIEHILHCVGRILQDSSGGKEAVFRSPNHILTAAKKNKDAGFHSVKTEGKGDDS